MQLIPLREQSTQKTKGTTKSIQSVTKKGKEVEGKHRLSLDTVREEIGKKDSKKEKDEMVTSAKDVSAATRTNIEKLKQQGKTSEAKQLEKTSKAYKKETGKFIATNLAVQKKERAGGFDKKKGAPAGKGAPAAKNKKRRSIDN